MRVLGDDVDVEIDGGFASLVDAWSDGDEVLVLFSSGVRIFGGAGAPGFFGDNLFGVSSIFGLTRQDLWALGDAAWHAGPPQRFDRVDGLGGVRRMVRAGRDATLAFGEGVVSVGGPSQRPTRLPSPVAATGDVWDVDVIVDGDDVDSWSASTDGVRYRQDDGPWQVVHRPSSHQLRRCQVASP